MGTHDDQPCDVRVSDDWTNPHMIICISYVYVCVYIYIFNVYIYILIYKHTYVVALVARLKKTHLENQSRSDLRPGMAVPSPRR